MMRDVLRLESLRMAAIVILSSFSFGCAVPPNAMLGSQAPSASIVEPEVVRLLQIANHNLNAPDISRLILARSALLLAQQLAPNDARVIDGFGCVSWQLGRLDEAEFFFAQAYRRDPQYARALGHLALAAYRRGDTVRARQLFDEALAKHPLDSRTRNNFAVLKWERSGGTGRNLTEILEELEKAALTSVGDEGALIRANLSAIGR